MSDDDYQEGDQLLPGEGASDWRTQSVDTAEEARDLLYDYSANIEYNIQRAQVLSTLSVTYAILAATQGEE